MNWCFKNLSLVIFVLCRLVFAKNPCSSSEFKDVASSTILADIVFVGHTLSPPPSTSARHNITFQVKNLFKGVLQKNIKKQYSPITIGTFADKEDIDQCISGPLTPRSKYIVFLRNQSGTTVPNKVPYQLSSFPVLATKKGLKDVKNHACANCGKQPVVKLSPNKNVQSKVGQKIQLTCKGEGKPPGVITWFKDSKLIKSSNRVQVKASRLTIKKAAAGDGGFYECQAANVLGESAKVGTSVSITSTNKTIPSKPHTYPCPQQDYCFNGGSCYILKPLGSRFCQCIDSFNGERCQEKRAPVGKNEEKDKSQKTPTDVFLCVLIVAGGVAGVVLVVAVAIVVCALIRNNAKHYRKRKPGKAEGRGQNSSATYHHLASPSDTEFTQNNPRRFNSVMYTIRDVSVQTEDVFGTKANGRCPVSQHRRQLPTSSVTTAAAIDAFRRDGSGSPQESRTSTSDADSREYIIKSPSKTGVIKDGVPLELRETKRSLDSDAQRNGNVWHQLRSQNSLNTTGVGVRLAEHVYRPHRAQQTTAF